jgi:hypothetical protein
VLWWYFLNFAACAACICMPPPIEQQPGPQKTDTENSWCIACNPSWSWVAWRRAECQWPGHPHLLPPNWNSSIETICTLRIGMEWKCTAPRLTRIVRHNKWHSYRRTRFSVPRAKAPKTGATTCWLALGNRDRELHQLPVLVCADSSLPAYTGERINKRKNT